jgi:hypothetical protein
VTRLNGAKPIPQLDAIGLGKWNPSSSRARKQCDFTKQLSVSKQEHPETPFAIGRKIRRESSQPLGENGNWRGRRNASRDPRAEMVPVRF